MVEFASNTRIEMNADPDDGHVFRGYTGDSTCADDAKLSVETISAGCSFEGDVVPSNLHQRLDAAARDGDRESRPSESTG